MDRNKILLFELENAEEDQQDSISPMQKSNSPVKNQLVENIVIPSKSSQENFIINTLNTKKPDGIILVDRGLNDSVKFVNIANAEGYKSVSRMPSQFYDSENNSSLFHLWSKLREEKNVTIKNSNFSLATLKKVIEWTLTHKSRPLTIVTLSHFSSGQSEDEQIEGVTKFFTKQVQQKTLDFHKTNQSLNSAAGRALLKLKIVATSTRLSTPVPTIRRLLKQKSGLFLNQMSDTEVIELFIRQVANGKIPVDALDKIIKKDHKGLIHSTGASNVQSLKSLLSEKSPRVPAPPEEEEEVKSKPPIAQRQLWAAIRLVDEDTGKPYSNVQVVMQMPDGGQNTFTTDGNGQVKIENLEYGMLHLLEIKDKDALEVVEMT